jgi:hypothetical protein
MSVNLYWTSVLFRDTQKKKMKLSSDGVDCGSNKCKRSYGSA